jgi:hypothetical protein
LLFAERRFSPSRRWVSRGTVTARRAGRPQAVRRSPAAALRSQIGNVDMCWNITMTAPRFSNRTVDHHGRERRPDALGERTV